MNSRTPDGLVGQAPELDLLYFLKAIGKIGRLRPRKLHHLVRRVYGLRILRRRHECSKTVHSGVANPLIY